MYRTCVLILLMLTSLLFAETPCSRMADFMREFNITLEELAKSTVLLSYDSYFVNDLFLSIIRQNPSIKVIAKIDSFGTTVARMTHEGANGTGKSVMNERWFHTVANTMQPYSAVWKNNAGLVVLFRAWPLIDQSQPPGRLIGIFTVKIDLKQHMALLLKNEIAPVEIRHNGEVLVHHKWEGITRYSIEPLTVFGGDELEVRYASPHNKAPGENPAALLPDPVVDKVPTTDAHITHMNTASGSAPKKRKNRPSQIPGFTAYSFPPTLPADSLFAISTLPPLSSSRIFFFILLAVATLIVIAASLIILVRGMLQTGENKKFYRTFRPGRPIDAIMVPDNNERAPSEDTKDFNLSLDHQEPIDISGPERETKALPAIRELIAEFSRRLKSGGVASDPIPRNNLVKEIQENLPVWVSCELRYLSNLLCSLAQSIKESENKSGQTADTQMLRYEIERIMDEISAFEQKIPPQNAT